MKKLIYSTLALLVLCMTNSIKADNALPSESFYKENIAVNNISNASPLAGGDFTGDDDDIPLPGDGGETGDGGQVNGPIGSALLPLMAAGLSYGSFMIFRKRKN